MPPTVQDGALSIRLPPTYNPKGPPDQMKDMLPSIIQLLKFPRVLFKGLSSDTIPSNYGVNEVVVPSKTISPTDLYILKKRSMVRMSPDKAPVNVWKLFF